MAPELAENLSDFYKLDKRDSDRPAPDKQEPSKAEDQRMKERLSKTEYQDLKDGKTSINKLAQDKRQLEEIAKGKLKKLAQTETPGHPPALSLRDYADKLRELEATDSPEKTAQIIKDLEQLEKDKETEAKKHEEEGRELEPNDPELLKLEHEFEEICNKNEKYIGTKELPGFKAWFTEQRMKKPTVAHLKDQIKRLKGEVNDNDGLKPRITLFETRLNPFFRKYGIASPLDSDFIKREGLSERTEFLENAKELELHFSRMKNLGLYSNEVIKHEMREMLMQRNPHAQRERLQMAKNTATLEQKNLTFLSGKATIGKYSFQAMSTKEQAKLLEHHKKLKLDEKVMGKNRSELSKMWEKSVENEKALAEKLGKVLEKHPELVERAVQGFKDATYEDKEKLIAQYEEAVQKENAKEELTVLTTTTAAEAAINQAKSSKYISEKTAKRFRENFTKKENYTNKETGRPNLEKLEEMYKTLISPNAETSKEKRNLAAYKDAYIDFRGSLATLQRINPDIDEKELKKWQEDYEKLGYQKKIKHHQDLVKEINKQRREQEKKHQLEKEAGLTQKDKEKAKEDIPHKEKTLRATLELRLNDQYAEALKLLMAYNDKYPDDQKILDEIGFVADQLKKYGSGRKREESEEKELEQTIKEVERDDTEIVEDLEEQQLQTLGTELADLNMKRHDEQVSAHKRSQKESMRKVRAGTDEEKLTEEFYEKAEQEQDNVVLDDKGKGQEVVQIEFNDRVEKTDLEKQTLKDQIYRQQAKIDTKKGSAQFELKDGKTGRLLKTEEAETLQEKELIDLEERIAQKAIEKRERKEGSRISDINMQVAAKRKAREEIDRLRHEKLDRGA